MSKRIPVSAATKAWRLVDDAYPGLAKAVGANTSITTEGLASMPSAVSAAMGAQMGRAGMPPSAARGARLRECYGEICDLAVVDPHFFPLAELVWLSRWQACKHVYRIDERVADALEATPIDGRVPVDALRHMPYPIVYIDRRVPVSWGEADHAGFKIASGFLAYMDVDEHGREQLGICYVMPDLRRCLVLLDVAGCETLDELAADASALDGVGVDGMGISFSSDEQDAIFKDCLAKALSLLLYVVSEENDPRVVYSPVKSGQGRRQGRNANPETITELGATIGRKLGEAHRSGRSLPAEGAGRTVAPHMRRGHWQSFWVGPRKGRTDGRFGDKLVVKWVSPVAVNGAAEAGETVHS